MTNRTFRESVIDVVRAIPRGSVLSYSDVAARAGFPKAARAVGSLMKANRDLAVPCHRVVRSDGRPGEYNRGAGAKVRRLKAEGVLIRHGRIVKSAGEQQVNSWLAKHSKHGNL